MAIISDGPYSGIESNSNNNDGIKDSDQEIPKLEFFVSIVIITIQQKAKSIIFWSLLFGQGDGYFVKVIIFGYLFFFRAVSMNRYFFLFQINWWCWVRAFVRPHFDVDFLG